MGSQSSVGRAVQKTSEQTRKKVGDRNCILHDNIILLQAVAQARVYVRECKRVCVSECVCVCVCMYAREWVV